MKKALLLFAALLVAGCGEKSSSEGSESASEKATASNESVVPSADAAKPSPAEPPVAESPSEEPSITLPLSDADVEQLLKVAVELDSVLRSFKFVLERDGLIYHLGGSKPKPLSGWTKAMWDSGQVSRLLRFKDGARHGPLTTWHENGQKKAEGTYKDGKPDGLWTRWHENGQKKVEATFKDGELISEKWWNAKGEEVETREEAEE
jgi:hypothetical protein